MLEQLLTSEAAVKINEGNNGIILEVDTSGLADEVREYFSADTEDDGADEEDKVAVKLLKIYTGTEGRQEYEMQRKARRILKAEKVEGASVPRTRNFRELKIENDEIINHLKSLGLKIGSDRIIEVLSMDLVHGQDLATLMYKAYVRKHEADFQKAYPDLEVEDHLKGLDINSLIGLVHHLAGIKTKHSNFDDSILANYERNEIAKIIGQEVAYQGLLEKKQTKVLLEAINALHQHGIYHRDLHPRNIMITDSGEVEIVDFGSATEIDPKNNTEVQSVYRAGPDEIYASDQGIVAMVGKLAKTETDKKTEARENFLGDPKSLRQKLSAKKPKIWQDFTSAIDNQEDITKTVNLYESLLGDGLDYKLRLALLSEIADRGQKDKVMEYLKSAIETESRKKRHLRSDLLINHYQALLDFLS